ncbi:Sporulation related domain-containing protein [Lishizhenia tianjinensis]|uniref:Sporulation related domain-containing protein n=1 Tax=Lishizhenia tianjinensis TaxID=477690 RepID=A0A1I7BV13_9FLAO|nr:SPOR domain-containing protein [Lishizhenia tianjinensis]SFT90993.1 Sporulation related domain-containing protein [Lishizhenia tianjinensis]
MNKYLQLLLQLESTVIIPEFGAIIIANEKTGDLLFNEYLKFNDGKLVNFIVENSNMDEQEALNFISKYVREINAQLDKGESYDMFEFGSFTKNKDGKIVFVPWEKIKDVGVAAVQTIVEEEEAQAEEELSPADEVELSNNEVEDTLSISEEIETPVEDIEEKPDEETPKKVNTYIPPTPVEEVISEEKEEETEKESKAKDPTPQPKTEGIKVATVKKVVTVPPKKEKKKNRVGLIIILVLIIGAGTFAALQLEKIQSYFADNKEETPKTEVKVTPEVEEQAATEQEEVVADTTLRNETLVDTDTVTTLEQTETAIEETEVDEDNDVAEETVEEITTTPVQTSGKYKMICGNFSELENAEKQVEELRAKGYNAEIIGIFGGLHRVSMNSYSSFQEAVDALPAAKQEVSGAYVSRQ